MRIIQVGFLFCSLFIAITTAFGQSSTDVNAALARGDYVAAFPLALQLAQSGNVSAEGLVGALYLSGNGTQQNFDRARYWLSKAASAGDARSANNLGYMYLNGEGVPQDVKTGMEWTRLAAERGDAAAENTLGLSYFQGNGIDKDHLTAWQWFFKSANQNFAKAQFDLGAFYQSKLVIRFGDPALLDLLKQMDVKLTADDLAAMQKKAPNAKVFDLSPVDSAALPWYQKAAAQGYAPAELNLGALYLRGKGTPQDATAAIKWFSAASQTSATDDLSKGAALAALMNLDVMYRAGWGVDRDLQKADAFLNAARAKGLGQSPFSKGIQQGFATGFGTEDCKILCVAAVRMGPGYYFWFDAR